MPAIRRPLRNRAERCVVPFPESAVVRVATGERVCGRERHDHADLIHEPRFEHDFFAVAVVAPS